MNSNHNLAKAFSYIAAAIFLVTGVMKLRDWFYPDWSTNIHDPVFPLLKTGTLTLLTGGLEVFASAALLVLRNPVIKSALVLWMSTSFLLYRLGSFLFGGASSCNCLGRVGHSLGFDPKNVNAVMLSIAVFLFMVSALLLLGSKLDNARHDRSS